MERIRVFLPFICVPGGCFCGRSFPRAANPHGPAPPCTSPRLGEWFQRAAARSLGGRLWPGEIIGDGLLHTGSRSLYLLAHELCMSDTSRVYIEVYYHTNKQGWEATRATADNYNICSKDSISWFTSQAGFVAV